MVMSGNCSMKKKQAINVLSAELATPSPTTGDIMAITH